MSSVLVAGGLQLRDLYAKCPSFVRGAGVGPDTRIGCAEAKAMAGAQVPQGCNYRHCNCRCSK